MTRFVQPEKIEIDANERAVNESLHTAFSFAPPSILSLTICILLSEIMEKKVLRLQTYKEGEHICITEQEHILQPIGQGIMMQ